MAMTRGRVRALDGAVARAPRRRCSWCWARSAGGSTPGCSTPTASPTSSPRRRSRRRSATTSPTRRRSAWPARRTSCRRPARSSPTRSPPPSRPRRSRAAICDFAATRPRAGVPGARRPAGRRRLAAGCGHGPQRAADHQPVACQEAPGQRARRDHHRSRSPAPSTPCSAPAAGSRTSTSRSSSPASRMLVVAMVKARDRVRAIRIVGVTLGGRRRPAPRRRRRHARVRRRRPRPTTRCAATRSPRSSQVLVGRLVGAGQAVRRSSASSLALAPGHDGGDLRDRVDRVAGVGRGRSARGRVGASPAASGSWCSPCARSRPTPSGVFRLLLVVAALLVALRGHRRLPAGERAARHRPHDPAAAQAAGRSACSRRWSPAVAVTAIVAVGILAGNTSQATRQPHQPGLQRLHRAVPAAAQPDRVAGEPQRDVVGGVQLPRRRAHDHDPRAAQRRGPVPHARRVLRLRRQRARAHEPRRRRRPRAAPAGARRRRGARARSRSARSPAWPTRRARSRTSTSATTSASSARCRRARSSATSTTSSTATSPTS